MRVSVRLCAHACARVSVPGLSSPCAMPAPSAPAAYGGAFASASWSDPGTSPDREDIVHSNVTAPFASVSSRTQTAAISILFSGVWAHCLSMLPPGSSFLPRRPETFLARSRGP